MCPVTGDASSVPSEQSVGCDEPAGSAWPGECGCDHSEQGPVSIVECGPVDLAVKDAELVAEHDDLEVFGTTRADR
jgi:hypothetical protein